MAEGLIQSPYLYVELNNKNISTYLTPYLINFTYTDNDGLQKDEVDDIEIEIEDSKGIFSKNPPARGSSIIAKFGYTNLYQSTGIMFVDSYTYRSSRQGDIFTIKALSTDVKSSYRTIKTTAFENTSIKSIAQEIANKNGYSLIFSGNNISFNRITQQEKRDLQFLYTLCNNYGFSCKVNDKKIIIKNIQDTLSYNKIYVLNKNYITDFEFETSSLFDSSIKVTYLSPDKKDIIKDTKKTIVKSGNIQSKNTRVENQNQANSIAQAQKTISELKEIKAQLTCVGLPNIYSSSNIEIKGFNSFDRIYYISQAKHQISRKGYLTELELYRNALDSNNEKK